MLSVDEELWPAFRGACILRGLTASRLFEDFMCEYLNKWGVVVKKEEPKRTLKKYSYASSLPPTCTPISVSRLRCSSHSPQQKEARNYGR